ALCAGRTDSALRTSRSSSAGCAGNASQLRAALGTGRTGDASYTCSAGQASHSGWTDRSRARSTRATRDSLNARGTGRPHRANRTRDTGPPCAPCQRSFKIPPLWSLKIPHAGWAVGDNGGLLRSDQAGLELALGTVGVAADVDGDGV